MAKALLYIEEAVLKRRLVHKATKRPRHRIVYYVRFGSYSLFCTQVTQPRCSLRCKMKTTIHPFSLNSSTWLGSQRTPRHSHQSCRLRFVLERYIKHHFFCNSLSSVLTDVLRIFLCCSSRNLMGVCLFLYNR